MARVYIEGAGFSMESATARTPDPLRFYIFSDDEIDCTFDNREEAEAEYRRRCASYWRTKMSSRAASERLMGARGLLSLDKSNLDAWEELARNGNPNEKTKAAFWLRKLSDADPIVTEAS